MPKTLHTRNNEYKTLIQEWEARNVERIRELIVVAKKHGTTLRGVLTQQIK